MVDIPIDAPHQQQPKKLKPYSQAKSLPTQLMFNTPRSRPTKQQSQFGFP
jgi:hypothetical protein